jgi:hypothetical protein
MTVFSFDLNAGDAIRPVVARTNHIQVSALASERRNGCLLPAFHPGIANGIVQTQGCFVHKEKLNIAALRPLLAH